MTFTVIETKKKGTRGGREFTAVPSGWLNQDKDIVFWPRKDITTLIVDEYSAYSMDWIPQSIAKVWVEGLSLQQAEEEVDKLFYSSDSESQTERAERLKRRQTSKLSTPSTCGIQLNQYSLQKPTIQSQVNFVAMF